MTEYLTCAQYSERYQKNPQEVRRMCAAGKIPAKKVGRVWRIAEDCRSTKLDYMEIDELRREVAELKKWKEEVCRVFSMGM